MIGRKQWKAGIINVTEQDIEESLDAVLQEKLIAVTINGKDDNNLEDVLFSSPMNFNTAGSNLEVRLSSKCFSVKCLFADCFEKKRVINDLLQVIKNSIITFFGVDTRYDDSSTSSTENHKELSDKKAMRRILCTLMNVSTSPLFFSDEVNLSVSGGVSAPHGKFDLLIGVKQELNDIMSFDDFVIFSEKKDSLIVSDVHLSETKAPSHSLAANRDMKFDSKDLVSVAQPVVEVLMAYKLRRSNKKPLINFYANRSVVRPFIYFGDVDVLFTTQDPHSWKDEKNLDLFGVILMALLMTTSKQLEYNPDIIEELANFFPKTGFCAAAEMALLKVPNLFQCMKLNLEKIPETAVHNVRRKRTNLEDREDVSDEFMEHIKKFKEQ